jgi:hypothetical protein
MRLLFQQLLPWRWLSLFWSTTSSSDLLKVVLTLVVTRPGVLTKRLGDVPSHGRSIT